MSIYRIQLSPEQRDELVSRYSLVTAYDNATLVPQADAIYCEDIQSYVSSDYIPHYCESCDTYHYYQINDGLCDDCLPDYEDIIHSYHYGRNYLEYTPHGTDALQVGIEIEVECTRHRLINAKSVVDNIGEDRCHLERDGSLRDGFEIVTQPHDEQAFIVELVPRMRTAFEHLSEKECKSHNTTTCGLHLHFSRSVLDDAMIDEIEKFYDAEWMMLVRLSRRTPDKVQEWTDKGKSDDHEDRYKAINTCNEDTIEFRLGRGTLKTDTVIEWVLLHFAIVKLAIDDNLTDKSIEDVVEYIIDEDAKNRLKRKIAAFRLIQDESEEV